ncbi:glutamyl-tRNA reductase [Agrococcus sp. Marseille-Q4369]|uniref:glutamyl-tRNA reductase n=1 Tax=Agrococcus sp. Marseille-Q4369 TaxID=2810513 RepID=UPI001B8B8119|nr:glutamyl-tRNA reductase [Agrococcus sp. Marseille-Q4369]QUW18039.1 glutamyl-tRNA reductase [Agrococcus sp. Marseille-Q4369]
MLICLTASHKNADFDVLEALSSADASALPSSFAAHPAVDGAVVISTCNRFEVYLDVDADEHEEAAGIAQGAAADALGFHRPETLEPLVDTRAAEHLFSVAAGLESVVIGEGEIAGQVRRALASAQEAGTTSAHLERLFQRASETQRSIKNRTGLGEAGRSIVRLALDLASARVDLTGARVLLVGTGRFAGVSLAELRRRGAKHIEVWSPSNRGEGFARSHAIGYVDPRDAALAAASADVIVTCTSSDQHVVDAALLRAGRERLAATHAFPGADEHVHDASVCPVGQESGGHDSAASCPVHSNSDAAHACPVEHGRAAQLVVDMGMPRNVDPDVATVPGVEVLDLETIRIHAPLEHLTATEDARDLVRKAARRFERGTAEHQVGSAIATLREHVEDALEAELARIGKRGTEAERKLAEQALRHFAGVVLHKPTVRARRLAAEGRHDDLLSAIDALLGDDSAA